MEVFKGSDDKYWRILEKKTCARHGEYVSLMDYWAGTTPEGINAFSAPASLGCPCCTEEETSRALYGQLCIPPRFRGKRIETFETATPDQVKAKEFFSDYARNLDECIRQGRSVIMTGKPGTGKTHLACGLLEAAHKAGKTGLFTSVAKIVRKVRESWRGHGGMTEDEAIQAFVSVDLLVVDEVGVQAGSENEQQILFAVLNGRYEEMRPTIVISNLGLDGVKKYLGERAFDRLRENGGRALQFNWESKRSTVSTAPDIANASKNAPIASQTLADDAVHPTCRDYQFPLRSGDFYPVRDDY